jgi:selenocysteine lyase/cysteine desulfurase
MLAFKHDAGGLGTLGSLASVQKHDWGVLPDDQTLEKITRYEAHLSRQLYHALHELENLQKHRTTGEGVPLARLDIQGLPEG